MNNNSQIFIPDIDAMTQQELPVKATEAPPGDFTESELADAKQMAIFKIKQQTAINRLYARLCNAE